MTEKKRDFELELNKFHDLLNQSDLVPEKFYRRNHLCYEMVSYINHIISLYMSGRYEVIPVFINRAFIELEKDFGEIDVTRYKKIAGDYLIYMVLYLLKFDLIDSKRFELIPDNLKP